MPTRNIYLTSQQDKFIEDEVRKGRYTNASEMLRAGLKILEERQVKIEALRSAVLHGMNSGTAEGDVIGRIRKRIKARAKANERATA